MVYLPTFGWFLLHPGPSRQKPPPSWTPNSTHGFESRDEPPINNSSDMFILMVGGWLTVYRLIHMYIYIYVHVYRLINIWKYIYIYAYIYMYLMLVQKAPTRTILSYYGAKNGLLTNSANPPNLTKGCFSQLSWSTSIAESKPFQQCI